MDDERLFDLQPRDAVEAKILGDPDVRAGLAFGKPRWGHPEGTVGAHVAELWSIIDSIAPLVPAPWISRLRLVALLHDIGKLEAQEPGAPHHEEISRVIAARFLHDRSLLDIIVCHDKPYRLWKRMRRTQEPVWEQLVDIFASLGDSFDLFVLFCTIDGSSGDKDPAPRLWLHEQARRFAPERTAWAGPARAVIANRALGAIGPHRDD